ncbi:hypothetical protein ACQ7CU_20350 [Chryseobacterium arthrosphaerae]|uniref:hypothetical protein n=1 Tax=Chryseobacterium arthrosphaerae TaxID=651561 RepID=UPI003D3303A6
MKAIQRILVTVLLLIFSITAGGYFYFDQKFTPEKNYLTVENESGNIPVIWTDSNKSALLLPIHFPGDSTTYYLQFDTGAVYTELYSPVIEKIKAVSIRNGCAVSSFYIGKTKITSDQFKVFHTGKRPDENDSARIIGTLGADILENRKTLLNFRDGFIVFNLSKEPDHFKDKLIDFTFKKRKIVINGNLRGNNEKFLYDSGTSAYELLTNKDKWEALKLPQSKVITEKARSRPDILTAYTAGTDETIRFRNKRIPLNTVTYVEGFSQTQYMLMKFSGMTGMLGNKVFLKNRIYIDCSKEKIGIE